MRESKGFYNPELTMSSSGKIISYNQVVFLSMATGTLLYADFSEKPSVREGDLITGKFSWENDNIETLFTSIIERVSPSKGNTFRILGREAYFKKLSKPLESVSWRKSNLKEVLHDLFEITAIDSFDIDNCGDISLSRFSFQNGESGYQILDALLTIIWLSTKTVYSYRPSANGKLIFGPKDQTRQTFTETISFDTGENILSMEDSRISAFALPVLFNQIVSVDGSNHLCSRSVITARPGKYRIDMEVTPL